MTQEGIKVGLLVIYTCILVTQFLVTGTFVISSLVMGAQQINVRLVGDPSNETGIVQVTDTSGNWVMIDRTYMNDATAKVLCNMLGYNGSGIAVKLASGYNVGIYGLSTGRFISQDFGCYGNESDLSLCTKGSQSSWSISQVQINVEASVISCEGTTLRLMDGASNTSGRLEVYIKGDWHTVCDSNFDDKDAQVVCSMLGHGNTGIAHAFGGSLFGQGFGDPVLTILDCDGDEKDIKQCGGSWSSSCNHRSDAGVQCGDTPIRLVGGSDPASGRVEISRGGQWGTLCAKRFEHREVMVLCRMLGYNNTNAFGHVNAFYGEGIGPVLASNAGCDGSETDIAQCSSITWYVPSAGTLCDHANDVGVNCQGQTKIRLADGPSAQTGRLEVFHNGVWGTVSATGFDNQDLMVVCRTFGFNYSKSSFYRSGSFYGIGVGHVVVRSLDCNGVEQDIGQCAGTWWPSTKNDLHNNDVGISCDGQMKARLVNGPTAQSGRLEVLHNGNWGTVSSRFFDNRDLMVVCRMLGFNYTENSFYQSKGFYGSGVGEVVVYNLECNGNEDDIGQCAAAWWPATRNEGHDGDVGISCDGDIPIRLVDGFNNASGRVEVMYNGHYTTVCDHLFSREDLTVICRMLGFDNIPSTASWHAGAYFGQGLGEIAVSELKCNGIENTIGKCKGQWPASSTYCYHSRDVSVSCDGSTEALRLVGSQDKYSGRVEINHNGEWGRICDQGFDRADAVVICRILGFPNPENAVTLKVNNFGVGNGTLIATNLNCNGLEDTLEQCNPIWLPRSCSFYHDIAVNCCPSCSGSQVIG